MSAMIFDTLSYTKKLQQVGFTQQQAEAQAEALKEVVVDHLTTKHDFDEFKQATKHDFNEFKREIKHDIDDLRISTKHDLAITKKDLIIKLGAIVASAMGVLSIAVPVLSKIL